jgi:hypothetical protein
MKKPSKTSTKKPAPKASKKLRETSTQELERIYGGQFIENETGTKG